MRRRFRSRAPTRVRGHVLASRPERLAGAMPAGIRYTALLRPWARPYHQGGSTCRPRPTVPALMAPGHTAAALGTCGIGWLGVAAFDRWRSNAWLMLLALDSARQRLLWFTAPAGSRPASAIGRVAIATEHMRQVSTATRRSDSRPRMTSAVLRVAFCTAGAVLSTCAFSKRCSKVCRRETSPLI